MKLTSREKNTSKPTEVVESELQHLEVLLRSMTTLITPNIIVMYLARIVNNFSLRRVTIIYRN
jgi:hypothetical protein